jgi:hypothetical protein
VAVVPESYLRSLWNQDLSNFNENETDRVRGFTMPTRFQDQGYARNTWNTSQISPPTDVGGLPWAWFIRDDLHSMHEAVCDVIEQKVRG